MVPLFDVILNLIVTVKSYRDEGVKCLENPMSSFSIEEPGRRCLTLVGPDLGFR